MSKPILCLDFDGVIHSYRSGWQGPTVIADPPVPGAMEFIRAATAHFTVAIFSSRSHQPGGVAAMQAWLAEWVKRDLAPGADLSFLEQIEWPTEKPHAYITLDDRAMTFRGEWPSLDSLLAFRPWHQRPAPRGPGAAGSS
jgi:hypothetical protein